MHVIKILMMMYDTTRQYLNFKQTGVWYSSSFGITRPSNLGCSTFDKQILPLTRSRRAVPYWAYFWCRNYRGTCDLCLTDRDTSIFSATETSQLLPQAKHCRHCVQQFLLARPVSLKFRRKPCQQLKYSKDVAVAAWFTWVYSTIVVIFALRVSNRNLLLCDYTSKMSRKQTVFDVCCDFLE